jgi:hypothetical protein
MTLLLGVSTGGPDNRAMVPTGDVRGLRHGYRNSMGDVGRHAGPLARLGVQWPGPSMPSRSVRAAA